jgi:hypothetical protein
LAVAGLALQNIAQLPRRLNPLDKPKELSVVHGREVQRASARLLERAVEVTAHARGRLDLSEVAPEVLDPVCVSVGNIATSPEYNEHGNIDHIVRKSRKRLALGVVLVEVAVVETDAAAEKNRNDEAEGEADV